MQILVILTLLWLWITACHGDTRGTVVTWELKPDARPTKELVRLAELLALHHLDSSGMLVPLDLETLTNISWELNP